MANYYRVAYKESQNTLKQICELFRVDSSDITIKFVVTVMGPLVFYYMWKYGSHGGNTPGVRCCDTGEQNDLEKGTGNNGSRRCERSV